MLAILMSERSKNANEVLNTEFYAWSISAPKFHVAVFFCSIVRKFSKYFCCDYAKVLKLESFILILYENSCFLL